MVQSLSLTTAATCSTILLASFTSKCNSFQLPVPTVTSTSTYASTSTSTYTYTPLSARSTTRLNSSENGATQVTSILDRIEDAKEDLVQVCTASTKPSLESVCDKVQELEQLAEQGGIGQASAHSGLLSGEWELIYSPEDVTRSSPFFWAFRKAFPDQSDQVFSITDSIPSPIKEVGPATQTIDMNAKTFVSRVKVATLGGLATSIMTTRATILGVEGLEGMRLKIDTTKPEESTVLQKLGPFGQLINDNSPPFPSGDALERVQPGSSEVVMQTTFCDEGLRISRNNDKLREVYVWKRKGFGSGMML